MLRYSLRYKARMLRYALRYKAMMLRYTATLANRKILQVQESVEVTMLINKIN